MGTLLGERAFYYPVIPHDRQDLPFDRSRARRRERRRDHPRRRLRRSGRARGAGRRADRARGERPDHRQQQRRQRRGRRRGAHEGGTRAQDRLLVPAPGRRPRFRGPLPRGQSGARARAAGHALGAHARRGRGDRRLLHAHRLRHRSRQGQGDTDHRRETPRSRASDSRGCRARQGGARRPLGESRLPQERAQLRTDHGERGEMHDRAGVRNRRARCARPRVHRHAGDLRDARGQGPAEEAADAGSGEGRVSYAKLTREQIAARIALDIPEGSYVNLGIGMPTLVGNHLPKDREIFLHSENGILGMGPAPAKGAEDWDLINAGKEPVTLLTGGAYFHHTDSFSMMRGGHLDIAVLGAFQVSVSGDLANWSTGGDSIPAVGGAMDLAVGAKNVWVMMEHLTKSGKSKIVPRCTYPLTGIGVVKRIYTDLAVIDVTSHGLQADRLVFGLAFEELQRLTGLPLLPSGTRAAA